MIPGLGRSPGDGKGYPLQYSGLENSMDWIVHAVAKSQTRLSDFDLTHIIQSNLLYSQCANLNINLIHKILPEKHPEYLTKYLGTVTQPA